MSISHYLEQHHVSHQVVPHDECFGAQHLAQTLHTRGREVAKSVLLRAEHNYEFYVVVLPATHRIDFEKLRTFLGGVSLELASEHEIQERCPDCERGVLPPFGTHYGARTIVDKTLTYDEFITFEGHTHSEAIRMKFSDYYAFEHPLVGDIATSA
jgi:Ala-tRNA(Pro) deacylase